MKFQKLTKLIFVIICGGVFLTATSADPTIQQIQTSDERNLNSKKDKKITSTEENTPENHTPNELHTLNENHNNGGTRTIYENKRVKKTKYQGYYGVHPSNGRTTYLVSIDHVGKYTTGGGAGKGWGIKFYNSSESGEGGTEGGRGKVYDEISNMSNNDGYFKVKVFIFDDGPAGITGAEIYDGEYYDYESVVDYHMIYVTWDERSYYYATIQNQILEVFGRKNSITDEITFSFSKPFESPTLNIPKTHELGERLMYFFNFQPKTYPETIKVNFSKIFLRGKVERDYHGESQFHYGHYDQRQTITEQNPVLLDFGKNPFSKIPDEPEKIEMFYQDFLYLNEQPFDPWFFDDDEDKDKYPPSGDSVFLRGVEKPNSELKTLEGGEFDPDEGEEFFLIADENNYYEILVKIVEEQKDVHNEINSYEFEGNIFLKEEDQKGYLEITTEPKHDYNKKLFSSIFISFILPIIGAIIGIFLLPFILKPVIAAAIAAIKRAIAKKFQKGVKGALKDTVKKKLPSHKK